MNNIILIGAGGHANSCIEVLRTEKKFNIAGFVISNMNEIINKDYKILGFDKDLPIIKKKYNKALIAIGQIKDSSVREKIFLKLIKLEFILPIIKSPFSIIGKNTIIKKGTIIMHHCVLNSNSIIEENCIINTKALIEHNVKVEKNCHISTGAILNGGVEVKKNTFIGSGSIIKEGVKIGENCIIGAGSIIKKNLPRNSQVL